MDVFTFIFLVVLVGCLVPVLQTWMKGRQHRMGDSAAESLRQEIGGLRERVQVLEKIVTDRGYEVRREFAALEKE